MTKYEILYYGGGDSVVIADAASNDDVAEVFHNERHTVTQSPEYALATARLFAAAPDLLAACEAAEDFLAAMPDDDGSLEIYKQLCAAIDRAKGDSA